MPKSTPKKPQPTKTSFVGSLPKTMPAKEVSKRAKAAGLSISPGYVYEIRSSAKRKKRKARAASKASSAATQPISNKTTGSAGRSDEAFRKLVLDLGLARSRALLNEVEKRLGDLIAGR